MSELYDLLLGKPLPDEVIRVLLFAVFFLHMIFVLFTLGTAILGFAYLLRARSGDRAGRLAWSKEIFRTFLVHKSLAVVLGVGPLLLIQIGFTVAFFTSVSLLAPYWIGIIGALIVSSLLLEYVAHRLEGRRHLALVSSTLGLALLLFVPGVFVAVLMLAANPDQWVPIARSGYSIQGALSFRWLLRYLHVLGAGVVFAAVFHYFFSDRSREEKRNGLRRWLLGGLLYQGVVGLLLYLALPERADLITNLVLLVGIGGAVALFVFARSRFALELRTVVPAMFVLLLGMLLTRQMDQNRGLLPLSAEVAEAGHAYAVVLADHEPDALAWYDARFTAVHDNGETIYQRSCAFCHGDAADGKGLEAPALAVPPADLSSIRSTRAYLNRQMRAGVEGSGMPYFRVYVGDHLDDLIDYLQDQHGVLEMPEALAVTLSANALQQSRQEYQKTCAACHGAEGRGDGAVSGGLRPPPPDFGTYSLTPPRMYDVISRGYPGTAMVAFDTLPEEVRWGLVQTIIDYRLEEANNRG